jgi:4-carboxymuconolactone decarboxylase
MKMPKPWMLGLGAVLLPQGAGAADRLPPIPPSQYDAAQQQAAQAFQSERKAPLTGPFLTMMYSPEVMTRARAMGDYLRYKSGIGNTLSELVIILVARDWTQDYEWSVHAPIAAKAGIEQDVIDAIRDGRRPAKMSGDEEIIYDFTTELLQERRVSDATFDRAAKRFGKPAIIDLIGVVGYYSLNAMMLNVAQFKPNNGTTIPHFP